MRKMRALVMFVAAGLLLQAGVAEARVKNPMTDGESQAMQRSYRRMMRGQKSFTLGQMRAFEKLGLLQGTAGMSKHEEKFVTTFRVQGKQGQFKVHTFIRTDPGVYLPNRVTQDVTPAQKRALKKGPKTIW